MTETSIAQDTTTGSPVRLRAVAAQGQPVVTPALEELYRGFEQELLVPLWTEIGDLMPAHPRSRAVPQLGCWEGVEAICIDVGRARAVVLENVADEVGRA